jgi:hypothetical protein
VQGHEARAPVVQVQDTSHKPIRGAYVEFDAPGSGAGATFENGSTHFATTTNSEGIASAAGLKNNGVTGAFQIAVHVSYQGQSIGELTIHQTNVARRVASMSSNLQGDARMDTRANEIALPPSVLGIALGDQFMVNGAPTPSNANLLKGTRLETMSGPATLFLHDKCEFLIAPRSTVTLPQAHQIVLESGSARARHFGNCRLGYGGLWVRPVGANADGVVAITNDTMEVASVSGSLEVVNTIGEVVGTIAPGAVSSFGTTSAASGASVGGVPGSTRQKTLERAALAVGLGALGVAVAAIVQVNSTSP